MKLAKGQDLTPLIVASVPIAGMKLVAALINDPNPIHLDGAAVAAIGLGATPINQGPVTISYLQSMIATALGGADTIRSFDARFLANVFAGDRVECTGTVRDVDVETGRATIDCRASVAETVVVSAVAQVIMIS